MLNVMQMGICRAKIVGMYCNFAGKNLNFCRKTFGKCLLVLPKDAMPPNFVEKTFTNSHNTLKFAFSLKSLPLYSS